MARCEFPKITCTCAKDVCNFLECPGYYNIQWRATRDRVFNPHISNADRIRSMTDEELAEYLFERGNGDEYCYGICVHQDDVNACVKALKQDGCIQSVVAWLKQEYTP